MDAERQKQIRVLVNNLWQHLETSEERAYASSLLKGAADRPDKLLTLNDLSSALGGISRGSIYRHIKGVPGFPQPVKVGASTRFRQSDVQAFIRGKRSAQ